MLNRLVPKGMTLTFV